eukprot:gene44061-50128_t
MPHVKYGEKKVSTLKTLRIDDTSITGTFAGDGGQPQKPWAKAG